VLDRHSLAELYRLDLLSRDVFTFVLYDEPLANGLRVGAQLGALRVLGSTAIVMDSPLREQGLLVRPTVLGSTPTSVSVCVRILSSRILSGLGSHPVRIGARWWDDQADAWNEISRIDLDAPLYPNRDTVVELPLPVLPRPDVRVRIGVLQEAVRWFEEVSPEAAVEVYVLSE
jgi:hypothetical protein